MSGLNQFTFDFEEVCLTLGKDKDGKRKAIALITGTATIETSGRGRNTEWDVVSVEIECPIINALCAEHTTIEYGHPLFNSIAESIGHDCGDKIWDDALEAGRPDPDDARDRLRDERSERADYAYDRQRDERMDRAS